MPEVGLVALAAAGVTVVYIYTDSIRELNVQAARQGVELNVGLVTTRLAVPPDEPLFLPLPGYELSDEFQNGIPVEIRIPENSRQIVSDQVGCMRIRSLPGISQD